MHNTYSFLHAPWIGGWRTTHLVVFMGLVLTMLWGSHLILSSCKALGTWHRRYRQLDQGQQRNVSLYIAHLLLDSVMLAYVSQPMVELWLGLTETTAYVQRGGAVLVYLVGCYMLELTWRRSIDTMLAIHHLSTILVIAVYAGEFSVSVAV
jgi:ABC-type nickel/cobalt efflux system permease component RcnA